MPRLIIIFTVSFNDWSKIVGKISGEEKIDNKIYIDCVSGTIKGEPIETIKLLILVNMEGNESETTKEIKNIINNKIFKNYEKAIGLHGASYGYSARNYVQSDQLDNDLPIYDRITTAGKSEYGQLIDEISSDSPNFENIKYLFDKVFDTIKFSISRQFFSLIHHIAHLFLPLDIDLMGIEEVKGNSKKVEYLNEVLKDKPEGYYKRKLLDLTTFVANINEVNSITANVDKKSIGKSIKEIIEESNIEVRDKQDMEKNLFALCAIDESGNAIDRKSPIYEFMNLLDAKIGKKNSGNGLNTTDVNEILEFLKNSKEEEFEKINSFHDWYCEVFRCLDSLRKKLDEEG